MNIEELKQQVEDLLANLEAYYPHKDISEYSRLVSQLESSLAYGIWEEIDEDA